MTIRAYIDIARPDHWFKNIFMIPGILLCIFFHPESRHHIQYFSILLGFIGACLVASSNYVINEILDAPRDRHHPVKKNRPIPSGQVNISMAYVEWLGLGLAGLLCGFIISHAMGYTLLALWIAGLAYNVPPVRTKDKPYLDVLSESINNPLRLLLGWYCTGLGFAPPLSALLAYWMFGGFLMAIKRFAEYRTIGNKGVAQADRESFSFYNEERLLVSVFFYAAFFALLSGYFISRYKVELILASPAIVFTMALYFHLGFKKNSAVQFPEKLYKERNLMLSVLVTFVLCAVLLYIQLPSFESFIVPSIAPPNPPIPTL
ncbi:MAG: prenyltransferase [Spartobacteria bacterium]|nr:prenyltransferase [Spartobacteria bacterium]